MMPPHGHSSSSPVFPLLVLSLLLLSPPGAVLAADGHPPSKPIVIPITKDSTNLYTIPVQNGAPLVLDLAGPLVWYTCPASQAAIRCDLNVCKVASRSHPAGCGNGQQQPVSPDGHCTGTCTAYPYNPASGQCGAGIVTKAPLSANATDGTTPLYPVSFSAYEACAPAGLLDSLPSGAAGVAGLSRQPLSLPSQVASRLKVAREFALCLPGVAIFGGGPFHLQGYPPADLADQLRQNPVPLLKNPKNGAYYIRVHGIAVNQVQVPVAPGAFDLDAHHGTGGVTFSTVTPYTTLRHDIFNALATAFDAVTSGIPRRKPITPFPMCFDASAFTSTLLGPGVANIDLMLDGRNWTLPGASSLVQVNEGTLCLAFLQMMGSEAGVPDSPAVIIGSYQMENNLLLFDLEKGTVGVSGLLFGRRTTCGNFNFGKGSA